MIIIRTLYEKFKTDCNKFIGSLIFWNINQNTLDSSQPMPCTIFVSSTFVDLQVHRKAIWQVLQDFDVNIRGMEQFGARTETPLETCIAELEQSDIYVGVIGFRLGTVELNTGKSYTLLEYERALALSKTILIYIIDEQNARVQRQFIDTGEPQEKLDAFKKILRERHTIETFVDENDLITKLKRDLQRHVAINVEITSSEDESHIALTRLQQFSILPKTVSGSEVHLILKIKGTLYSASKSVCSAFNLEFGATAGVQVDIVSPSGSGISDVPDLLIPAKLLVDHLPLAKNDLVNCYVRLHFSAERVGNVRARHKDQINYPDSKFDLGISMASVLGKPDVSKADSQLAFEVSRIIDVSRAKSVG